ncbi:LacI family transcriptional regulator [Breznakia blatticola]|uniref:LacI family transcriptional regulator n=1 Tax=Breznakia blatticola TaxID=1754012 RepID=A0A4R7ZCR0_9FIRM|nr:LacI family DNA-binding transcriptional regulator [Breznakia blatticola]TDW13181.1 LacI family transcriptional regulator [Breznakia blatticola]
MKDKQLTMQDIADLAGVGKSTVSRYFNGGYVKEETRRKLKEIIEKVDYTPNTIAQSLKATKTKTIGIVAPCLDSITSSRVMMALDEYVRNEGYVTIIINTNHNEMRELTSIEHVWKMNVDAIVLIATNITEAHRQLAHKIDVPMLFIGQVFSDGYSIVNDDYHAGFDMGEYVAKKGHMDITYVGVNASDRAVGIERKKGVMDGFQTHGVSSINTIETDFTFTHSQDVISAYLKKHIPSVFICATDTIALACYKEVQALQLKVPEDISIVGFGGYESSSVITPSLCTVRFDNEMAGKMAGEAIIKWINGEIIPKMQSVGYTIIEGESVQSI